MKKVLMLSFVLILVWVIVGRVSANPSYPLIRFSAMNSNWGDYDDLEINFNMERNQLKVNGDIWYQEVVSENLNFSLKKGKYEFIFISPFNIDLAINSTFPVFTPIGVRGGYSFQFNFVDEVGNYYEGTFNGVLSSRYSPTIINNKMIAITGHYILYTEDYKSEKNEGNLNIWITLYENGSIIQDFSYILMDGFISRYNQRISSLESNQTLIQSAIQTLTSTLTNILDSLNDLILKVVKIENENKAQQTKIDNHESRIKSLENSSSEGDSEFKSYLKYLSDSDKKKILCGYAEEKHLTHIEDLGLSCDLTYKTSKSGKETVRCKC